MGKPRNHFKEKARQNDFLTLQIFCTYAWRYIAHTPKHWRFLGVTVCVVFTLADIAFPNRASTILQSAKKNSIDWLASG